MYASKSCTTSVTHFLSTSTPLSTLQITCGHLLTLSGGVDSVTGVLKRTQLLAAKCVLSGAVGSAEVLSLDMIRNTLAALTQMALLSQVQG